MPSKLEDLVQRLDVIEELLRRRFGPVTDPAPDDWGRGGRWGGWLGSDRVVIPFPFPNPGDPAPLDFSRFSRVQLEMVVHQIKAERIRLDSMETLVHEQTKSLGKG